MCIKGVLFLDSILLSNKISNNMLSTDNIQCYLCSKYNFADGMRQMFDPFERVARAHHICPCCERPFSPDEEDEFVKKVGINHRSYLSRL